MTSKRVLVSLALLLLVGAGALLYWWSGPRPGHVKDEALLAGRDASSFPAADDKDDFHEMDGAVDLTPDEIKGRNTWVVWTAGNDRLLDKLSYVSAGALDFLQTLSSH